MPPTPSPASAGRPGADEFAPFYAGYVARVPEGEVAAALESQLEDTLIVLRGLGEDQAGHRYAPGKWSIREVVGHLADTERIMAYRALRIARGDATPLPGFAEDDYVAHAGFDERTLQDLCEELSAVRLATLLLLRGLPAEAWTRRGTSNGHETSVRALAYVIAGHELHHREILRERYL